MMNYIVFYIVILLTNIVQGITGFAGTILAMPPSLMLVGYDVAKPVLNVLGLFSGIYVFCGKRNYVDWREVRKIILVMAVGMLAGFAITSLFVGKEKVLYKILGGFVLFLSIEGIGKLFVKKKETRTKNTNQKISNQEISNQRILNQDISNQENLNKKIDSIIAYGILALAGIVHGMFVCGGPLLIGYLSKQIKEKESFRATISTVWIALNAFILANDIRSGFWNLELVKIQLITIPFLLGGMFIGSRLCERMSQQFFLILTYVLLFVSGCSLIVK